MDPPECSGVPPSESYKEDIVNVTPNMEELAKVPPGCNENISQVAPLSEICNEEIVAELTKDMNEFNLGEESEFNLGEESESSDQATLGGEPDDNEETPQEDDFDEEILKEWELTFTDEQKEEKRTEAGGYKDAGNALFKTDDYSAALDSYTQGLQNCPLTFNKDRAVLFSNRAAAKIKLGRTKSALEDCSKAMELDPEYVRAIIRRATLHEQLNQLDEALADWKVVLQLQPGFTDAMAATQRLPPLIEEKNEKLKTEMLDKLKSLGNMLLRPFGLSSNNFQMVPNGEGGYSVQFQK